MENRDLICIGCPLGCPLTVTIENGEVTEVKGNTCPKGDAYARKEVTNPTRIVTSTVVVEGGVAPMVSCKTAADIPKGKIFDVTEALKDHEVKNVFTKGEPIDGYDPAWGKAWRRYDKSKFED